MLISARHKVQWADEKNNTLLKDKADVEAVGLQASTKSNIFSINSHLY